MYLTYNYKSSEFGTGKDRLVKVIQKKRLLDLTEILGNLHGRDHVMLIYITMQVQLYYQDGRQNSECKFFCTIIMMMQCMLSQHCLDLFEKWRD